MQWDDDDGDEMRNQKNKKCADNKEKQKEDGTLAMQSAKQDERDKVFSSYSQKTTDRERQQDGSGKD